MGYMDFAPTVGTMRSLLDSKPSVKMAAAALLRCESQRT